MRLWIHALACLLVAGTARAADKVEVQLDWVVRGNHAMFFVAREKGYFASRGIEVSDIRRGTGSPDTMRLVASGRAQFGFGDLPTLAVARSQDVPVVALAAVNQSSPLGMIALSKTVTLKAPADLKGLTIGIHPAGSTYIFWRAFLTANGLAESDFTISTVSPPYESFLLLGRVQAVPGYIDAEVPELEAKAGGPGSLSILLGSNFGWPVYGSGLVTSEAMVRDRADLVSRFVAAYRQAFADVVARPEEASDITARAVPGYDNKRDVLLAQLKADIQSTFSSGDTRQHGLGWMTTSRWEQTLKTLSDQGVLRRAVPVDAVFTTRFLPAGS